MSARPLKSSHYTATFIQEDLQAEVTYKNNSSAAVLGTFPVFLNSKSAGRSKTQASGVKAGYCTGQQLWAESGYTPTLSVIERVASDASIQRWIAIRRLFSHHLRAHSYLDPYKPPQLNLSSSLPEGLITRVCKRSHNLVGPQLRHLIF